MPFDPLVVVTPDHNDQRLIPAFFEDATPVWEAGDTNVVSFRASGLGSCQGSIGNERVHADLDAVVYLSDARVVVVCERWAKGAKTTSYRSIITPAIANRVSQHRADKLASGKLLVGQMRYPWISRIAFSLRENRKTENSVRLIGTHLSTFGEPEAVSLVLHLDRSASPSAIADQIFRRVVADRLEFAQTTPAEKLALTSARWPSPGEVKPGTIPSVSLAGSFRANSASAYLGVLSSRSTAAP